MQPASSPPLLSLATPTILPPIGPLPPSLLINRPRHFRPLLLRPTQDVISPFPCFSCDRAQPSHVTSLVHWVQGYGYLSYHICPHRHQDTHHRSFTIPPSWRRPRRFLEAMLCDVALCKRLSSPCLYQNWLRHHQRSGSSYHLCQASAPARHTSTDLTHTGFLRMHTNSSRTSIPCIIATWLCWGSSSMVDSSSQVLSSNLHLSTYDLP